MTADPVGAVLLLAAPLGVAGVFALALLDRFVPLLPSYGLFTAIGVAAAEGLWCLPTALLASVLGSGTAALGTYRIGSAAGAGAEARLRRHLLRRDHWGRLLRRARRVGASRPLTAQLIPATRVLAPLVGGAVARRDRRRYLLATVAGLTLWNATFIALGYAVVRLDGPGNATLVSIALVTAAAALALLARLTRARRNRVEAAA